jgi:predicted phage terminase large subunit-like protein
MKLLQTREQYDALLYKVKELDDPIPALRALCRNDLYFLLRYALKRADADKQWLFERCREVQAAPNDHLDLWSREHYKSTIITFAKTIQDILINPNVTVGIFSHTRPIAKGFLRQIKQEFESNKQLQQWFPDILYDNPQRQSVKWSEDDGITVKRDQNPKEATVEAWGLVDGQPIGKHFSLLVYDDIVTAASVTSPDMIQKTTDALSLSYNLGAVGGHRRFIGTRYHFGDTYKVLMDRETATPRIYAATHDGSMDGEPVLMPDELLQQKRRDMGIYVYSCQMLQNPIADQSQGFQREWVQYYDTVKHSHCNWYMLVDPANGKRKHNDYTSIWMVGLSRDGNYYCLPVVRDRLNVTEIVKRIIQLHRMYRPIEVRIEQYGLMTTAEHLKNEQEKEGYRFPIYGVGGSTSKVDRMKRLIPDFEQGRILLPIRHLVTDYEGRSQDNVNIFIEQELLAFPVMAHDDMLDCLARIKDTTGYAGDKTIGLSLRWPEQIEATLADYVDTKKQRDYHPLR